MLAASLAVTGVLIFRSLPAILYPYIDRPPMMPRLEPLSEVGSLSAERCGACHQEHYREWSASLMAQAATNPFFTFERAENKNLFLCGRCHFPLENQEPLLVSGLRSLDPLIPVAAPNPSYDEALQQQGVTCAVCHMRAGTNAILNARALPEGASPHPLEQTKVDAICERCHQFDPIGTDTFRPPLDTFSEYAEYVKQGGKETCVSCHMPAIERASTASSPVRAGHDHRFLGARDPAFIEKFVTASIGSDPQGLFVEVENRAGHRVPTAEPSRVLRLVVELVRADGSVSAARVVRILRDMDTLAVADRFDNTLGVAERRKIRVEFGRAEIGEAARARVIVELHRYELSHPLVQIAGPERFSGLTLIARAGTSTLSFAP